MTGLPWVRTEWLDEATAWIRQRVDVVGEITQPHVRWWSTVLRVPTGGGDVWFKANAPKYVFEAALMPVLARWCADDVIAPIAVDEQRGWLLLPDGGARLREVFETDRRPELWLEILPRYAELQIALAPHRDELLGLGVPDLRLATLSERLDALLGERPAGLTDDELRRLRELDLAALCEQLAAFGIPETLQHDDLHDGNVFVAGGRYRVFDWGDSCVSHPFHSLTVALRATAWKFELPPGGDVVLRLRDAYLEPWTRFARRAELVDAAGLAYRLGTLARALAWHASLLAAPVEPSADDLESVPYGLKLFLENGPIGTFDYAQNS